MKQLLLSVEDLFRRMQLLGGYSLQPQGVHATSAIARQTWEVLATASAFKNRRNGMHRQKRSPQKLSWSCSLPVYSTWAMRSLNACLAPAQSSTSEHSLKLTPCLGRPMAKMQLALSSHRSRSGPF
eukprot:1055018-Amphidinium_carterae.1